MNALITTPLDAADKNRLFRESFSCDAEALLLEYVGAFLRKNRIRSFLLPKMIRRRLVVTALFCVVLFLDIVEFCFLHRHIFWNLVIPFAAALAGFFTLRSHTLRAYLIKEIKMRPDGDLDSILSSQVSGARPALLYTLLCAVLVAATVLGSVALFYHPLLVYERNDSGYSVRYCTFAFSGQDSISVPDSYNGLPVTEIRGSVFKNLGVRLVRLPQGLTEIRGNTFENSSKLEFVTIPSGVMRIGGHAFYGCRSLRHVDVPDTVKKIGSSAFRRCSSLYTIRVPYDCLVNSRAFKESPTRMERY